MRRNRALSASISSSSTSRPWCRMPTRSAIRSTPARSWVVMNTVVPRSARSPISSSKTALRATASSPSVGSSSTSRRGELASARASKTCPFCPLESLPNGRAARHPEPLEPRLHPGGVPARIEPGAEAGELARRHRRRRVRLLGHHPHLGEDRGPLLPDVPAEQQGAARRGLLLPQQAADERRLAGAVAAEQGVDRPLRAPRARPGPGPAAGRSGRSGPPGRSGSSCLLLQGCRPPRLRQAVSNVASASSRLAPRVTARLA